MFAPSTVQPSKSTTTRSSLPSTHHLTQHHGIGPPRAPPYRLPLPQTNPRLCCPRLTTRLLDGAQGFDYETQISDQFHNSTKLKIGVIGFGNFGQFLAKALVRHGHTVLGHSRSDHSDTAAKLGVSFFADANDLCEEHPDVIILCTSILSTESVLRSLPLQRLKQSTLFVDVLSVKEFPRNLFMRVLPPDFDILCTHPMFGPQSAKYSWTGLPFVYDKVRIGCHEESRISRCDEFLKVFATEGCRMVEMSCAEHDWHAAGSQFIAHTMGRLLEKLSLEGTPINTKGYEILLNLVEYTSNNSFDLYYGLFLYNKNAMEQLERLDLAFESLKEDLFGHLHDVLRKQLIGKSEGLEFPVVRPVLLLPKLHRKGKGAALPPPSDNVTAQNDPKRLV